FWGHGRDLQTADYVIKNGRARCRVERFQCFQHGAYGSNFGVGVRLVSRHDGPPLYDREQTVTARPTRHRPCYGSVLGTAAAASSLDFSGSSKPATYASGMCLGSAVGTPTSNA